MFQRNLGARIPEVSTSCTIGILCRIYAAQFEAVCRLFLPVRGNVSVPTLARASVSALSSPFDVVCRFLFAVRGGTAVPISCSRLLSPFEAVCRFLFPVRCNVLALISCSRQRVDSFLPCDAVSAPLSRSRQCVRSYSSLSQCRLLFPVQRQYIGSYLMFEPVCRSLLLFDVVCRCLFLVRAVCRLFSPV